jgi:arylsulfatase A-like enzyme
VVRQDVAHYHDTVTLLDYVVGDVLKKLEDEKLAENTIVIFFGDHGWGMPRGKRWLYDSGVKVPLIVRWPGQNKPGSVHDELVGFIDFAPTMLALAGAEIPAYMQGQVFLGPKTAKEREYVYGARDRMDETYDHIRYARDKRFKYIRNFEPQIPYALYQHYNYMTPTLREWYRLAAEGKLEGSQKLWWAPTKPKEELYDCDADPHEVNNLADKPEHAETLKRMRAALDTWIADTKDMGSIPETEMIKQGLVKDRLSTEYNVRDTFSKNFPFPPRTDAEGLKEKDWLKNEK